jgi:hypothetical protein
MRLISLILLTGCASENAMRTAVEMDASGGAELDFSSNQLRVDIIPSGSTPWLEPQTWISETDTDWDDLRIEVAPSVTLKGQITGYTPTPYGAEVPGADNTPVGAYVSLVRAGTITGSATVTNEDGTFSLTVPASHEYRMSIVPGIGQSSPMEIVLTTSITEDTELGVYNLGHGVPVHGQITDSDGEGVFGVEVFLEDKVSQVQGSPVLTNDEGRYLLRANPGEYVLVTRGQTGRAVPSLRTEIVVQEDSGAWYDIDLGDLESTPVHGQIMGGSQKGAIRDVRVRFTSEQLLSTDGALEVLTETDGDGLFNRDLLPGTWLAEIIPPFDSTLGSTQISFVVDEGARTVDLGQVLLPSKLDFSSIALDPDGRGVSGAAVNARELGFDGYIHSTTTDDRGRFNLQLSPNPISLMIVPAKSGLAVTHVFVDPTGKPGSVAMSRGERVTGQLTSQGVGVGFALVEIRNISGTLYATALTDPDGNFSVRVEPF